MNNSYLKQRRKGWYIRVPVPKYAQEAYGQKEVTRTLKTKSLSEAKQRKHAALTQIYSEINEAVSEQAVTPDTIEWLKKHYRNIMSDHTKGLISDDDFLIFQDILFEKHRTARGDNHTPKEVNEIKAMHQKMGGRYMLSDAVQDYLKSVEGTLQEKTIKSKRRTLDMLIAWTGDKPVEEVTRRMLAQFMDEELNIDGRAVQTVLRFLAEVGGLWSAFLIPRGHVENNPVTGLSKSLATSKRGKEAPRRPWTSAELTTLLTGLEALPRHRDLSLSTLITTYTGVRRSELMRIKIPNVGRDGIKITEGKTRAALRTIPIHPIIAPLVTYLVENSSDGYLLPTDRRSKSPEDALGKRFTRIRRELGVTDSTINIHTLRNSFINACENSQVLEHLTKVMCGHTRESLTYGLYSPANAVNWKLLVDSMNQLSYGETFDNFARKHVASIIDTSS